MHLLEDGTRFFSRSFGKSTSYVQSVACPTAHWSMCVRACVVCMPGISNSLKPRATRVVSMKWWAFALWFAWRNLEQGTQSKWQDRPGQLAGMCLPSSRSAAWTFKQVAVIGMKGEGGGSAFVVPLRIRIPQSHWAKWGDTEIWGGW